MRLTRKIGLLFILVGVLLEILSFFSYYSVAPACPAGDTACGTGGAFWAVLVDYEFYLGWVFIAVGGILLMFDAISNRRKAKE